MYSYSQLYDCVSKISIKYDIDIRTALDITKNVIQKNGYSPKKIEDINDIILGRHLHEIYKRIIGENFTREGYDTFSASKDVERFSILDSYDPQLTAARETADWSLKHMTVDVTGARPGEVIVGIHNISRDAVMRIRSGMVIPRKDSLDNMRLFPQMWSTFIMKLKTFDFFSHMESHEIEAWLRHNQRSGDYDMAEIGDVHVDVLDTGKSNFGKISQEQLNDILLGNISSLNEIRDKFPKKVGSKARRHTLIFFLHWWKIRQSTQTSDKFDGIIYDMGEERMRLGKIGEKVNVIDLNNEKLGIFIDYEPFKIDYLYILKNKFPDQDFEGVKSACKNFTSAGYKSLLQKIVRYSPLTIDINGKAISSDYVICVVFTLLLMDPGSFVPDIQRFVSGQESAFKRLIITIFEDGYYFDPQKLLKITIMALLSQRIKSWKPSIREYEMCLEVCIYSLNSPKYYIWNLEKGSRLDTPELSIDKPFDNITVIMESIKSFESDIFMLKYIAKMDGKFKTAKSTRERPKTMKIQHCIDQHWAPEIVFLLPTKIVETYSVPGSKPFSKIYDMIFHKVTGINTRKENVIIDEFTERVKSAQSLIILGKQAHRKKLPPVRDSREIIKTELDISWISGMVGVIESKGRPPAIVTMRPEDPYQLVALRKPSRGMKDGTLSDERTESAIRDAKNSLRKGLKLETSSLPIRASAIYLVDGVYTFKREKGDKDSLEWKDISKIREEIDIVQQTTLDLKSAILVKGKGIQENAYRSLKQLLKLYDDQSLRRTLTYISTNKKEIEISRPSKDGGGTLQAISPRDVSACQLILYISLLFPSAITRLDTYISRFLVTDFPLLWKVRDIIRDKITPRNIEKIQYWPPFRDVSLRVMKSYQIDSVNEMIKRTEKNKKGHFLWMTVGLGKTLCVLTYIKYLRDTSVKNNTSLLPDYIIYSLPKSALNSIIKEIKYFKGLDINLLLPIKNWKNHPNSALVKKNDKLVKHCINLIDHDHLRKMEEHLIDNADNSIFIIDEVHKALNDTKRTNVALEISKLSKDFIALTGTPIVDSNTYKLIWWLEQIVEFDVNEKNFWVAANGMIAKRINTGVSIDKLEVEADMLPKERQIYESLVSQSIGGKKTTVTTRDISQAFDLCYDVCDRKMVEITLQFLEQGKGVMMVARNTEHQNRLRDRLSKKGVTPIFLITKDESIFLTDESVESGITPDYKVVITTIRRSEGYTLTRMRAMVTSVYPSNQATRDQLEGRINRISQRSKIIHYRVVHTGILSYVLAHHNDAASLSAVLKNIAQEVNVVPENS